MEPDHPINDDMQVDLNMSVESINIKIGVLLAVPVIALGNQPSMRHTINSFIDGMFKNVLKFCTVISVPCTLKLLIQELGLLK